VYALILLFDPVSRNFATAQAIQASKTQGLT
jgi:hypothetical protein